MPTKKLDAIKLVRELRDQLTAELAELGPKERARRVRERAASTEFGRRLVEEAERRTQPDPSRSPKVGRAGQ